ncbi:hypothetical protein [Mycobacterium sp. PSTR-4-N]|uniref:hypothetical protein n=1 Tax=Mycobacterium sp. PSTR-4-N TaxID=2917745 RepID=UPI001F149844|nr:hypothetical protein [Mycobacterium sp. PSTR-4-N]MCG7596347.1 hypothetical protein [Mycobacterium sp. PSTR-4-N]
MKTGESAGQKLIAELSRPNDPYSLTFLIQLAGDIADEYEQFATVLSGDRGTWVEVKIGAKTVEVVVTDVIRQKRATAEQLRKLISSIIAQRAAAPEGPNDSSVLAGLE